MRHSFGFGVVLYKKYRNQGRKREKDKIIIQSQNILIHSILFNFYTKSKIMQQTLTTRNKVKLHFLVKKRVNYGFAVYVAGNQDVLGGWQIPLSLRLNWNTEDYWSGFVQVIARQHQRIQFKYLVANYDNPTSNYIEWQQGQYNRQLVIHGDEDHIVLQNVWGANKICLNLLVPKIIIKPTTQIYLAGGCNELGNWKNRIKLNKIQFQSLSESQILKAKQNIIFQEYQVYSVSFSVDRNLRNFNYFFLKKLGVEWMPDRIHDRQFKAYPGENQSTTCLHVSNKAGNYDLLELSKFVELHYSKIIDQVYVGGCIETMEDVKQLKKKSISAIVYLYSSSESSGRSGPKNLIKLISEQNKIQYHALKISLSKTNTLIEQVRSALRILAELLTQQKTVYVNCRTGSLLSPLLVALYLSLYQNMNLKRALQYVKQKHPISAIDQNIMTLATGIAQQQFFSRQDMYYSRRQRESVTINFD